jgi:hypothetical protein
MTEDQQMNMKDFAKYLTYTSFDEALHHIRRMSLERIIESETSIKGQQQFQITQETKILKTG